MNTYRHGDVNLLPVKEIPKEAKKEAEGKERTIALGEATGHHHTLYGSVPNAIIAYGFDEQRYIEITEPVELKHQEHKALTICPGYYEIKIEREFDYFEKSSRKVLD